MCVIWLFHTLCHANIVFLVFEFGMRLKNYCTIRLLFFGSSIKLSLYWMERLPKHKSASQMFPESDIEVLCRFAQWCIYLMHGFNLICSSLCGTSNCSIMFLWWQCLKLNQFIKLSMNSETCQFVRMDTPFLIIHACLEVTMENDVNDFSCDLLLYNLHVWWIAVIFVIHIFLILKTFFMNMFEIT